MEPRAQRIQFYDALYMECSGAQINLRAIRNDGQTMSRFVPVGGDRINQLEAFVRQYNTEEYVGLYHAVATRNGGGKKEHIVEIPSLWADIDFKDMPEAEARQSLNDFQFKPSAVIASGGGLQPYWFLKEPAGREDIAPIEDVLKRLQNILHADRGATDASRILRIPGTVNRKKVYSSPRKVTLEYCEAHRRYNFEGIRDFLPAAPVETEEPTASEEHSSKVDRVMQCLFLQHCDEDRATLPEPQWYCMVSNLARCKGGPSKVHELSRGYPGYNKDETNNKILHAINDANPHTCRYIKRLWDCGTDCGVKAPAALALRARVEPIRYEPLSIADTSIESFLNSEPAPREYYFDGLIPKGIVGNISARGGTSKSFLIITLCMGLATGKKVLEHFTPSDPTKVLALFAEDCSSELHRRIRFTADTLFPNMDSETRQLLIENFHARSVDGMVGGLMQLHEGNPILAAKYEWLTSTIEAHEGVELLFLDPKSRFYGLDELNNDHNTMWLVCLENLRSIYNLDVIFTHHVSQSQGDKLVQTAARGGTALIDGVRWAANLRTLTERDAKHYDLEDFRQYVEFDVTKSNYAPMLPRSLYFKRGAEGVLMPVDLRQGRLEQIIDVLIEQVRNEFSALQRIFTVRELIDREPGKELRERMKEALPSCTAADIRKAADYACKEKLAKLIPDAKNNRRKLFCPTEMEADLETFMRGV